MTETACDGLYLNGGPNKAGEVVRMISDKKEIERSFNLWGQRDSRHINGALR